MNEPYYKYPIDVKVGIIYASIILGITRLFVHPSIGDFFWKIYALIATFFYIYATINIIGHVNSSEWMLVPLIIGLCLFNIIGLYSYVFTFIVFRPLFWKLYCLLSVGLMFVMGSFDNSLFMTPLIYSFYYIGFKNKDHDLLALITRASAKQLLINWNIYS